jgi:GNAT superfamily N-acetyltransferase
VSQLQIRPSRASDEAGVRLVERLAEADLRRIYRPTAAARRQRAGLDQRLRRLVATLDGRLVGTVQYYLRDESLAFLGFAVHPECRRRGVARALLAELETVARSHDLLKITLYTIRETGNVSIFRALGYTIEGEEVASLFERVDSQQAITEVSMSKLLST